MATFQPAIYLAEVNMELVANYVVGALLCRLGGIANVHVKRHLLPTFKRCLNNVVNEIIERHILLI